MQRQPITSFTFGICGCAEISVYYYSSGFLFSPRFNPLFPPLQVVIGRMARGAALATPAWSRPGTQGPERAGAPAGRDLNVVAWCIGGVEALGVAWGRSCSSSSGLSPTGLTPLDQGWGCRIHWSHVGWIGTVWGNSLNSRPNLQVGQIDYSSQLLSPASKMAMVRSLVTNFDMHNLCITLYIQHVGRWSLSSEMQWGSVNFYKWSLQTQVGLQR